MDDNSLVGIGLYTPAEAGRLIHVSPRKIVRWLQGHRVKGKRYGSLWQPQVRIDGSNSVFLGFRDLMEMRVAHAFIEKGVSAIKIRRAIEIAREELGLDHPLSTTRFKTDGRTIFLVVANEDGGDPQLLELFSKQYAFRQIIEASLKDLEFDDGLVPSRWWPAGKSKGIVVDPDRSFGQPVDSTTGVPTSVLSNAAIAEGSPQRAAKVWSVSVAAIRAAVEFERAAPRLAA